MVATLRGLLLEIQIPSFPAAGPWASLKLPICEMGSSPVLFAYPPPPAHHWTADPHVPVSHKPHCEFRMGVAAQMSEQP